MIMHISIPTRDPRSAAEFFAAVIDGAAMPFPVAPGAWCAIAKDGSGAGVELMAEDTAYYPGHGEPDGRVADGPVTMPWETQVLASPPPAEVSAFHAAMAAKIPADEIIALARARNWRAVECDRGGVFGVVEVWVDNRHLVEVMPPAQVSRYLAFYNPAVAGQMFGAGA